MRKLTEVKKEVRNICTGIVDIEEKVNALKQAGYVNIHIAKYSLGQSRGIYEEIHLKRKKVYRIQITDTWAVKRYPAAWAVDVCAEGIEYEQEPEIVEDKEELPF
jgi:hypothetical protein